MNNNIKEFPIEYYGLTPSDYPSPTIIERDIHLDSKFNILSIIRVYLDLDIVFSHSNSLNIINTGNFLNSIYNLSIKFEYMDGKDENSLSIYSEYIYITSTFNIDTSLNEESISPKINDFKIKLLSSNSFHLYISIAPY
ncbi:hypothetical protein ACQPU1_13370 [Clostridium paraputrificum]|uniref:hypothetical protein n=1 Tax=Clostridium TaxID=1485 RepID=UPI003D34635D